MFTPEYGISLPKSSPQARFRLSTPYFTLQTQNPVPNPPKSTTTTKQEAINTENNINELQDTIKIGKRATKC
jgi:hypothetical protein